MTKDQVGRTQEIKVAAAAVVVVEKLVVAAAVEGSSLSAEAADIQPVHHIPAAAAAETDTEVEIAAAAVLVTTRRHRCAENDSLHYSQRMDCSLAASCCPSQTDCSTFRSL